MQVDRARDDLADGRNAPVGRVVLGLPVSIARLLTVLLFREFRGAFPNASLEIVEGLSVPVLERLITGRIDRNGLQRNALTGDRNIPAAAIQSATHSYSEKCLAAASTLKMAMDKRDKFARITSRVNVRGGSRG